MPLVRPSSSRNHVNNSRKYNRNLKGRRTRKKEPIASGPSYHGRRQHLNFFAFLIVVAFCFSLLSSSSVILWNPSILSTTTVVEEHLRSFRSSSTNNNKNSNSNKTASQRLQQKNPDDTRSRVVGESSSPSSASSHTGKASLLAATDRQDRTSGSFSQQQYDDYDIRICFITCEFGDSIATADVLPVVDKSMRRHPSRHFVYTNFQSSDFATSQDDNGWEIIQLPDHANATLYTRMITKSRWGKFMAFLDPRISEQCDVVFYGDAYLLNPMNESYWQSIATKLIDPKLQEYPDSKASYYQNQTAHMGGLIQQKQPYTHDIPQELRRIIQGKKDTREHVDQTRNWLRRQSFFRNMRNQQHSITVYKNAFFGYHVHNTQYQQMAIDFWNVYSKELGSWRDQPYWAYFMALHNVRPLLFDREMPKYIDADIDDPTETKKKRKHNNEQNVLPFGEWGKKGHGGHVYVKEEEEGG